MTYHDELINYCSPYQVTHGFSTFYDRPASQINISAWGLVATVDLNCDILYHGVVSPQRFNLQTQIDLISGLQNGGQELKPTWDMGAFVSPTSTWAQVLMLAFRQETITAMMNQTNTFLGSEKSASQHNLSGGYVQLVRSNSSVAMRDDLYFDKASWVFLTPSLMKNIKALSVPSSTKPAKATCTARHGHRSEHQSIDSPKPPFPTYT